MARYTDPEVDTMQKVWMLMLELHEMGALPRAMRWFTSRMEALETDRIDQEFVKQVSGDKPELFGDA